VPWTIFIEIKSGNIKRAHVDVLSLGSSGSVCVACDTTHRASLLVRFGGCPWAIKIKHGNIL